MFTGIIEKMGTVRAHKILGSVGLLSISSPQSFSKGLKAGDSVAVNGVCLTLVRKKEGVLFFDTAKETLKRSSLRFLKPGENVHLELPLKRNARLHGHFVQGHVDGTGRVLEISKGARGLSLRISTPPALRPFILEKGSVAVDGVSLTIGKIPGPSFWAHLIPHTLKKTRFRAVKKGECLNLEADVLVKLLVQMFR